MTVQTACTLLARGKCCYVLSESASNKFSDGNIRYFEYENDKFEFLSEYKSGDPQRGIAFMPRRGINVGFSFIAILLHFSLSIGARQRGHESLQDGQRLLR
jgi:hypothetical protein